MHQRGSSAAFSNLVLDPNKAWESVFDAIGTVRSDRFDGDKLIQRAIASMALVLDHGQPIALSLVLDRPIRFFP